MDINFSIGCIGGGNSWVNKSVLDQGIDFSQNQDLPPWAWSGESETDRKKREAEEKEKAEKNPPDDGGTVNPIPPPAMPQIIDKNAVPRIPIVRPDNSGKGNCGYDPSDSADPAKDTDPSNDNKEYIWVIRDANGNITACCTIAGNVYIFPTNENGERTGTKDLADPSIHSKDNPTARSAMVSSWKNICTGVASGSSKIAFYNEKGDSTAGYIGMVINSKKDCLGIFVDRNGTYVRQGLMGDFQISEENGEGADPNDPWTAKNFSYLAGSIFFGRWNGGESWTFGGFTFSYEDCDQNRCYSYFEGYGPPIESKLLHWDIDSNHDGIIDSWRLGLESWP
ncbi:MAG TPA: hypothetical protein PL190_08020 [Caldisericia bacterium]|nr:hypothetical protein [Caldisericia bacterium]HPA66455.1 hypothetical protein [Caldisericia bacterium]HQL69146.1 hypothetical protein [Caldisericia bacterium]HQN37803.1 hypothetical protein [Caldisericia bacterium]HUN19582.1 hypothetical protein [Caldisericia bacterium]